MRRGRTARWAIRRQRRTRGNFFLRLAPRFALRQTNQPSHRWRMSYDPTCGSGGQVSTAVSPAMLTPLQNRTGVGEGVQE